MTGQGGIGAEKAAELEGMGAAEAVREIPGGATGPMPSAGHVTFPGPVAQAFFFDDADVNIIMGPVGSGKTTTTVQSRIRRAVMMPRSTIDRVRRYTLGVFRHTYRELWSTTIPSYLEAVPKALGTWAGGRGDPVTHTVHFEDEHGSIEWTAAFLAFGDDPAAAMRGVQVTDAWLNEFDTLPEDVLMLAIGRIDRAPARTHFAGYPPEHSSYGQIVGDMNAPSEDQWAHSWTDTAKLARLEREINEGLAEGQKRIRLSFHRQPGAREPGAENLANLGEGYYRRQVATMKLRGRGDMIQRLVDNKPTFIRVGEPVFQREFNPAIHVAPERIQADPELPLLVGLDQGFTPAAVVAQNLGPLRWRFLAELMFPTEHLLAHTFGERFADLMDERFPGMRIEEAWGDMAGEAGAAQAEENATWNREFGKAAGVVVRPQVLGGNRIQPRLEAIRAPLEYLHEGQPGLLADPSMLFFRAGMEAQYVWTEKVDDSGNKRKVPDKSKPVANVLDAAGYLLLSKHRLQARGMFTPRASSAARRGAPDRGSPGLQVGWDLANPYGGAGDGGIL
ncbi:hypothetical protein P2H44_22740 [Albimonas sp. CAU 1670]|uniref:hypothetical protein n=1 Tax=Albimonas sp. CAU 1670 TaxID=3032599 RepID=UPI0023D9F322|nr:hypothetical protein [Albimonas sp. CAU 1670]MDF2235383.1 hypothetical protein [Albimonas sp. CAU 1670]